MIKREREGKKSDTDEKPGHFLGTEGVSWVQGKNILQKICLHVYTLKHTHIHTYGYWPGIQVIPAKEAESKFYFLLQKYPN